MDTEPTQQGTQDSQEPRTPVALASYLPGFQEHEQALMSKNSARGSASWSKKFSEWVATENIDLTSDKLATSKYVAGLLADGKAVGTCHIATALVRRFLKYLASQGVAVAPQDAPELPKPRHKVKFVPDDDQVTAFVKHVHGGRHGVSGYVMSLMPYTGMRDSELLELKWEDWDVIDGFVVLKIRDSKNGQPRTVPILEAGAHLFNTWVERRGADPALAASPWLFPSAQDPKDHVHRSTVEHHMRKIRGTLNMANLTCHKFRAYYVDRLTRSKLPPQTIAALIGHSNLSTFMDYYKPADKSLVDAVRQSQ